ncbi:MAG TPA: hypothetical protein VFW68_05920, partial [Rhodocyclaceae bacterium]|nr:hypothetical protein [Rhodocyclaceae bacterium]
PRSQTRRAAASQRHGGSMMNQRSVTRGLALAATLLALAACSRLTQENYDKLKTGMAYEDVEAVLGRPTQCSEALTVRTCIWGDEASNINANFVAGKAVLFSSKNIR